MNFKEHIKVFECQKESKVVQVIEEFGLCTPDRKRTAVYQRAFLYNELRTKDEQMTFSSIGELFDRDHATVLHGLKTHEFLTEINDKVYRHETKSIREFFYPSKKDKTKLLHKRIFSCHTLFELNIIKSLIESGQL